MSRSKNGEVLFRGPWYQGAYLLQLEDQDIQAMVVKEDQAKLWHSRLAHLNYGSMLQLARNTPSLTFLIPELVKAKLRPLLCDPCIIGKMHRVPSRIEPPLAKGKLERIFIDLCSMPEDSIGGAKGWAGLTNDATRHS
jgi:hypothetical protein